MGENDIVIIFDKNEVKPKEELNGIIKSLIPADLIALL